VSRHPAYACAHHVSHACSLLTSSDYKYFKQYKFGDVTGPKPSLWSATMKAGGPIAGAETLMKFDAWTEVKGMSKEEALTKYVEVVVRHTVDNNREEVLLKFVKGAAAAS